MSRLILMLAVVVFTTGGVLGGLERGNRLYRDGNFVEAVEEYRSALADGEDSPVLRYNLGTALLQLGRFAEAEEHLRAALDVVEPELRERVYYNMGQRYLLEARQGRDPQAAEALYDAAVEAYRQALRLRPSDADARWNYELALRERERQQQSGGGGGQPDQEQEQGEDPQQGQGAGSQARPQTGDSPAGQGGASSPMSQEQAERLLSAIEQDERDLFREKLQQGQRRTRTERDW